MKFIDLFAGAGGLSEGFIRAGFEPVAHVEMDRAACFSLKTRAAYHWLHEHGKKSVYINYLKGDLTRSQLYSEVPEDILDTVICAEIGEETIKSLFERIEVDEDGVDLIVGGPPCQAYSIAGRSRDENGMEEDDRNYLYKYYARFLKRYSPKMFVFENVTGLLSAGNGQYWRNMTKYFKTVGYNLDFRVVNARDFGVLQNRKRVIIVGWRKGMDINYPEFDKQKWSENVSEIFRDLEELNDGEGIEKGGTYAGRRTKYLTESKIRNGISVLTQHVTRPHTDRDKEIYRIAVTKWMEKSERLKYNDLPEHLVTHKNIDSHLDRFKVVASDLPFSHTVVAHISKDGHYYIHPDKEQNRSLSVREAARLQSFPDDFFFEGIKEGATRTAAFKQIGNAVPPLMAEKIALAIKPLLQSCSVELSAI